MDTTFVDLYQYYSRKPLPEACADLSVTVPEQAASTGSRPAVLILPGGGYDHVSDREGEPVARKFTAAGYVCFVLKYSCAPLSYPVQLQEAAMAMGYIRQNAERYGVDPEHVAAVGFSAGGHLCGMLGMLYDVPELAAIGTPRQLKPDALGLCYPVAVAWGRTHEGTFQNISGAEETLRGQLSLEKRVRPDMPPVFIWHTRQDVSVPCRNSLLLAAALEEQGVPFALHIYHRGPHGLSVANESVYEVGKMPAISWDVPGWITSMQQFFEEFGFRAKDLEVPV